MLPTNVMSFMKKMVANQPEAGTGSVTPEESGTTFSKLRQLGSGLITATGNVTKLSPAKVTPVEDIQPKEETPELKPEKPPNSAGACRICRKSFKPDDFFRTCHECQNKVCEDCASYSNTTDSEDQTVWRCSVCRRKLASRGQPIVPQESTDSLLEVPVLESLPRRHSDARLGSQTISQLGALGAGLAPPRSPELRRHSDVSPASLKELEKVAGERREEIRWERELEWRNKSRSGSPERHQNERADRGERNERGDRAERGRATSPQRVGKRTSVTEQEITSDITAEEEEERRRRARRRASTITGKSRVTRQRSYDDEIKTASMGGGQSSHSDVGLGLPVQLPRRASAYDVFATPGGGSLNAMAIVAAQHRASFSSQGSREPEDRPSSRRPSIRATVKPVMPYDIAADEEKIINLDLAQTPEVAPQSGQTSILAPDEERRTRRRGSHLPDINAIRALPMVPAAVKTTPSTSVNRVSIEDRDLARQGSLVDGEGIKIVIHDVDSEVGTRGNTKRRVVLRRDTAVEKGHRSQGFGMRVVGGKVGSDGHLFAQILLISPGGPAEKSGLQAGDKILEWSGVSLVDRNFKDVAQIIDRSSDIAELVVEQGTDTAGDSLDDGAKSAGNLNLQADTDTDKTPSSPTRRKLPKTPEQIAKEREVRGRVQIHVWYEGDRKELVVSVLAADNLCAREDTGHGTMPEAYAKLSLVPACGDHSSLKTDIAEAEHNPIWNATLNFTGISGEKLMDRTIEVNLWDRLPEGEDVFLGECTVDLQNAFETDRAVWYRLEDPRGIRMGNSRSPRGSMYTELVQRLIRRELQQRSYSDDTHSESGSPEPCYLHPDHALYGNSRRGSSQSEQLEFEPYELNKDYSRSLPGSRRSSFQSQQGGGGGGTDSKRGSIGDSDMPVYYNRERRRSSVARYARDPKEILEGLKSLQSGKSELGRTLSLTADKRRSSRSGRGERKESVVELPEKLFDLNYDSDDDERWRNSGKLGPGQVAPKGGRLSATQNGELQLAVFLSRGNLEVEVICARGICPEDGEVPYTYIKTFLCDEGRKLQKRKTRVQHSRNPQYRETIKYSRCDAFGRILLVMLWEKKQGFGKNQGLGEAEICLDNLPLTELSVGWYILFPIHNPGTQNIDSP
ncbi:regulating synaptic membrane exocytosis protein 1 isoform X2 [Leptopilina boulardi]|uniref:regulating synaptic membrane exocytosis protein 1 isoform X2 n=1 Tax=Leptopilina boulardi TaxID=63433 RepID=UPI0021F561A3|nr:regulating synaptic membrane exocytosis protein 1 isoform X2 [Leptopilina boulardi]